MTVGLSNTILSFQSSSEAYAQGEKFNAKLSGDQQIPPVETKAKLEK